MDKDRKKDESKQKPDDVKKRDPKKDDDPLTEGIGYGGAHEEEDAGVEPEEPWDRE